MQSKRGHGGVVVGGPECCWATGRAHRRWAVSDGRPGIAQHRRAVKGQRSVAVVILMATVRVQRGDANSVAVHAERGAVDGRQGPRGAGPL